MRLSRSKIIKRLLLATLATTSLMWCPTVYAEVDFERPDNPSNNTVTINANSYTVNGTTTNYSGWFGRQDGKIISGGFTMDGTANGNVINIVGGDIRGNIAGAYMFSTLHASVNTVNISGGKITGSIYSVYGGTDGYQHDNMINIWGNPDLSSATLHGTRPFQQGVSTVGSTLNIATKNLIAKNIYQFYHINFFLPSNIQNGETMLTLTDTSGTDLPNATIRVAMQGGSNLDTGDTITLIKNENGVNDYGRLYLGKMSQAEYDAIKDRLPAGMLSDGVSLDYDMTIEKSGDNAIIARIGNATTDDTTTAGTTTPTNSETDTTTDTTPTDSTTDTTTAGTTTPTDSATDTTTNSTATVPATIINGNGSGNRSSGKLLPQTQLIANSTVYPTLQLVDFMNDKLVDWLPPSSFDFEDEAQDDVNLPDVPQKEPKGYEIFITGSGGSFRTKTGSGSYIESTLKGFDVGFGRSIDYSNGRLVFAPIFEYATGDYDSYLDDGMHGKGSTKYMAGGLIGRKTFKSGLYIEASARGGKTERDFSSDTMTSSGSPIFVHYSKTSAPIFSGHLRIGKQLRLNKNNLLDAYGIYFHTHQGSMNVNLSTGEDYHFSSANAGKLRLGYRLTTRTSKISRIYTGLAFQYEHNSDAIGMYKGRRTPGTGNHGASGMLELGWMIRPNKDNPWMLDLNATGFVGHQRGLSGTLKLQKEF